MVGKSLVMIYRGLQQKKLPFQTVAMFSDSGLLPREQLLKAYKSFCEEFELESEDFRFAGLEEMDQFLLAMVDYFNLEDGYILSVEDFNIGLEGANEKNSLSTIHSRCGRHLIPKNSRTAKSALVKRLFNS